MNKRQKLNKKWKNRIFKSTEKSIDNMLLKGNPKQAILIMNNFLIFIGLNRLVSSESDLIHARLMLKRYNRDFINNFELALLYKGL